MQGPSSVPPLAGTSTVPSGAAEAIARLGRGSGGILLATGGARAVQASFLNAMEGAAREAGAETVRLKVHPLDLIVPYGALQPWLATWYKSGGPEPPAPSTRPRATASMPLIGLLLGLPADGLVAGTPTPGIGAAAGGADPARSFSPAEVRSELIDLVEGRTRKSAAVVLVEDAEFLDPSSADWFSFLSSRVSKLPLLIVCSVGGPVDAWRSMLSSIRLEELSLGPPSSAERTAETLQGRVRALPLRAQEMLGLIVLAGPDAETPLIQRALGGSEQGPTMGEILAPAVAGGLIRTVGTRFECLEPSLYPDLSGALTPARVAAAHLALAQGLTTPSGSAQGPQLFRLSEHWALAGQLERGVPCLLAAAREAERWGAPALAAQRLQRAVHLAQGDPSRQGRQAEERSYAELAALYLRAGEPAKSVEANERALSLSKARGAEVEHWGRYVAGIADARAGMGEHPEELLRTTLAELAGRAPDTEALLFRSLAFYYIERARFREAIPAAERACAAADRGHDELLQVQCHSTLARSLIYVGERSDEARAHLLQALDHRKALEGTADQVMVVGLLDGMSLLECGVGNEPEALRWGEEALEMSRRCGYGTSFLWVLGNLAEEHIHVHGLERARVLTEEFRRLLVRLSVPDRDSLHQQLHLLEGRMAFETGDLRSARASFERIVRDSEEGGSRVLLAQGLVHLIVLEVASGDLEAARRHVRALERTGLDRSLMGETRRLLERARAGLGGNSSPKLAHSRAQSAPP